MKWNEINSFSRGSEFVTTPGSHHYQTVKPRLTVLLTRLIHQVCRYVAAGACFKRAHYQAELPVGPAREIFHNYGLSCAFSTT